MIIKPFQDCQGRGIFLSRASRIQPKQLDKMVVQKYISNPHLINGLKYDLRLYVILTGISPLRVYISKEGLARFATEHYSKPNKDNMNDVYMHLTNYAINKDSDNYLENQDEKLDFIGSKRSFTSILNHIQKFHNQSDVRTLLTKIQDIVIKSLSIAKS